MPSASECSNYSSPGLGSAARSGLRWRSDQEAGNCALYCDVAMHGPTATQSRWSVMRPETRRSPDVYRHEPIPCRQRV